MLSYQALPFEVKSLILFHYCQDAETQRLSRLALFDTESFADTAFWDRITSIVDALPEMRSEIIWLLEQARKKYATFIINMDRVWEEQWRHNVFTEEEHLQYSMYLESSALLKNLLDVLKAKKY